jgi:hypothetical protein
VKLGGVLDPAGVVWFGSTLSICTSVCLPSLYTRLRLTSSTLTWCKKMVCTVNISLASQLNAGNLKQCVCPTPPERKINMRRKMQVRVMVVKKSLVRAHASPLFPIATRLHHRSAGRCASALVAGKSEKKKLLEARLQDWMGLAGLEMLGVAGAE